MKSELRIPLCGLFLLANLLFCHAHDNVTMHPLISDSAAKSSTGLPDFLTECFGYSLGQTNLSYSDPDGAKGGKSPLEWIKAGSQYEDVPWIRGNNHFYDPTKKPAIGLTDGVNLGGQPSFIWATVETNAFWWQHSYTWLKARSFELNALTNSCKSGRETNLAAMLFYLGHVIHLNQDLTVPAHVRNDNHGVNAANGPFAALVM
jgi:hypothetical protein